MSGEVDRPFVRSRIASFSSRIRKKISIILKIKNNKNGVVGCFDFVS